MTITTLITAFTEEVAAYHVLLEAGTPRAPHEYEDLARYARNVVTAAERLAAAYPIDAPEYDAWMEQVMHYTREARQHAQWAA